MSEKTTPRRLAAILHADVVGYSRLMGAQEEDTIDRLIDYRAEMTRCINEHSGHVIDTAGDSLLAEFSSVVAATKCALELQENLRSRNSDLPSAQRLEFRMGIEMADVIARDDAVYGDGINVAARIQALAEPGGVCVSDAVRRAVANRLPVTFVPMGEHAVKNITEPVKAFKVVSKQDDTPPAESKNIPRQTGNPRAIIGTLTGVVLLIVISIWFLYQHDETPPSATEITARSSQKPDIGMSKTAVEAAPGIKGVKEKPSIAVLPFVNMSGDKEQDYFSDGISEDIIIDLSRVSNLQVIARNSTFYYKSRSMKPQDIGGELGVRYVVTGSVRKAGSRVRITAQLIESKDAHQLWADKFDRRLEDIFSLQDEITQKIVSALVVQLSVLEKAHLALKATRNVAAYDLFLQGQRSYRLGTKEGLETAQSLYRQAVQLDPRFGRAYGALAVTLTREMARGFIEHSTQGLDQALELAKQAVNLNSTLPQTYWALGYVYRHRNEAEPALAAAQRSIEVAPNYADGYALLASINNQVGRGQEAIRFINRAMALNPHYTWEYSNALGRGYFSLAEYDKAAAAFLNALARNEFVSVPRLFLIASYVRLNRIEDARWEVTQLKAQNPEATVSHFHRQAYFWDKQRLAAFLDDLEKAGVPH